MVGAGWYDSTGEQVARYLSSQGLTLRHVLIDARKPNFKKTAFGVLPIDLILADLTSEMTNLLSAPEVRLS